MRIKDEIIEEIVAGAVVGIVALAAVILIKAVSQVKDTIADI